MPDTVKFDTCPKCGTDFSMQDVRDTIRKHRDKGTGRLMIYYKCPECGRQLWGYKRERNRGFFSRRR